MMVEDVDALLDVAVIGEEKEVANSRGIGLDETF